MSEDNHKLKVLHDQLLACKPDSANHDEGTCPLCASEADDNQDHYSGGSMPESFSQDEVDAVVAAATSPLQTRLAELEAQMQETEVGRAVAEAVAAKDTSIAELQQQLDAAVASGTASEHRLTEVEQFWEKAFADQEAASALATARETRVAEAKEAGALPDDYVEAHADRFAAMTAEDWTARLDEWRLIAAAKTKPPTTSIPTRSALVAAAATSGDNGPDSALAHIFEMRSAHVDPRTLGGAR